MNPEKNHKIYGPITDGAIGLEVAELRQTCEAYPSQWEGKLVDGKTIYIRYRGVLTVQVGQVGSTIDETVGNEPIYRKRAREEFPGGISYREVKKLTGLTGPKGSKLNGI